MNKLELHNKIYSFFGIKKIPEINNFLDDELSDKDRGSPPKGWSNVKANDENKSSLKFTNDIIKVVYDLTVANKINWDYPGHNDKEMKSKYHVWGYGKDADVRYDLYPNWSTDYYYKLEVRIYKPNEKIEIYDQKELKKLYNLIKIDCDKRYHEQLEIRNKKVFEMINK